MRETFQDLLQANGFPGLAPKAPPCCRRPMPSFAILKLTEDEAADMEALRGEPMLYACGACLSELTPAPQEEAICDPDDPWSDNEFANGVRAQRFQLLLACDWTQVPDVALTEGQREDWRAYRQALRDITETFSSPLDPAFAWPTPPAA